MLIQSVYSIKMKLCDYLSLLVELMDVNPLNHRNAMCATREQLGAKYIITIY